MAGGALAARCQHRSLVVIELALGAFAPNRLVIAEIWVGAAFRPKGEVAILFHGGKHAHAILVGNHAQQRIGSKGLISHKKRSSVALLGSLHHGVHVGEQSLVELVAHQGNARGARTGEPAFLVLRARYPYLGDLGLNARAHARLHRRAVAYHHQRSPADSLLQQRQLIYDGSPLG